jgi:hypothetical protein
MIVPHAMLWATKDNDYHMVLPQECDNFEYLDFYRKARGYKILDNGAAEASPVSWETLIALARTISANAIVAPDALAWCDQTIEFCRQFEPIAKENLDFTFIGVLQGKSLSEVIKCFHYYEYTPWITTIALPRLLCKEIHPHIRCDFMDAFADQIEQRFRFVHCLGGSEKPKEVIELRDYPMIRGIDTSTPAVMGLEKIDIREGPYVPRQPDFFETEVTTVTATYIQQNIQTYLEWAR